MDLEADSVVDRAALERALEGALRLMATGAMQTKLEPLLKWVSGEAPAKFVVFASPIETVDEIRLGLERLLGEGRVVTITGSLKPHERRERMQAFRGEGVRVLVASKAGSEGINLQVSHRLVHFDVPWNPHGDRAAHRSGSPLRKHPNRGGRHHRRRGKPGGASAEAVQGEARSDRGASLRTGSQGGEPIRGNVRQRRVMTQVSAEELAESSPTKDS